MTTYKNSFHKPGKPEYGPALYETDAKPEEYKGLLIYRRLTNCYDIVVDGVCIGQYAGPNGARNAVDTRFASVVRQNQMIAAEGMGLTPAEARELMA
jgi:hypothetical protein